MDLATFLLLTAVLVGVGMYHSLTRKPDRFVMSLLTLTWFASLLSLWKN